MRLVLHLENAGEQRPVTGDRFTIGRARENDWVLPDPEQHLSRQHCVIERRGAAWCVVDTSANGVFVNGEASPVGRGRERSLGHGDRLQLGSYVIGVAVEGAAPAAPAPERGRLFDPPHAPKAAAKEGAARVFDHTWVGSREALGAADHRASPVGRSPDPRFQTPPEHRPVDLGKILPAADLFDSDQPKPAPPPGAAPPRNVPDRGAGGARATASLFDGDDPGPPPEAAPEPPGRAPDPADPFALADPAPPPAVTAPPVAPAPPPIAAPLPPEPVAAAPLPQAPAPAAAPAAPDLRLLEAFLEGTGLAAQRIPVDDPQAFMREAGARLRELTDGLVQLLNARAALKNAARIERTTVGRDLNNPLKYSIAPGEALLAVLVGRGPGFLSPEAAVRAGFRDLQEHEIALLDAMQVALRALLRRFEPQGFERQLEAENLFSTLIGGGRRAKCWDAFKARYERIASEAEREFLGEVGADFARGYEARTRRM
ncbi:MAG TPA: type VI secretion system-associated FHA domain protein TagH [Geminicoccaceae bacterium]|nr:type VI secretion system-associated FHA domain protein TagH [Geminicoccaceae bacterium]